MRSLLLLLLSLFILGGCGKATFDNKGSQQVSSFDDDIEVIPEDEASTLAEEDSTIKDGDDGLDDDGDGHDDDGKDHDEKDHHKDGKGHRDKDHTSDCKNKNHESHHGNCKSRCGDKSRTPREIFEDPKLFMPFVCHHNLKKVWICQYPSGDEDKKHTLCVNENSISKLLHERRQDIFVLGQCSDETASD